jgi:hypothetical protein
MFALITRIARFLSIPKGRASLARSLLESAEARAGHGLQEASDLREAAVAYLRVVR